MKKARVLTKRELLERRSVLPLPEEPEPKSKPRLILRKKVAEEPPAPSRPVLLLRKGHPVSEPTPLVQPTGYAFHTREDYLPEPEGVDPNTQVERIAGRLKGFDRPQIVFDYGTRSDADENIDLFGAEDKLRLVAAKIFRTVELANPTTVKVADLALGELAYMFQVLNSHYGDKEIHIGSDDSLEYVIPHLAEYKGKGGYDIFKTIPYKLVKVGYNWELHRK